MRPRKERLTVTVDRDLVVAGNEAVSAGRADSLSAWVNTALAEHAIKERHLSALAEAVAAYEGRFGAISARELEEQARVDRETAVVVRGAGRRAGRRRRVAAS